jgi:hypothetical protein
LSALGAVLLLQQRAKVSLFAANLAKLCLSGKLERAQTLCAGSRDPWVSALSSLLGELGSAPRETLARRRWLLSRMMQLSRGVKLPRLWVALWLVSGLSLSSVAALCVLAPVSLALPRETLLVLVCLGLFVTFQSLHTALHYLAEGNKALLQSLFPALYSLPLPS